MSETRDNGPGNPPEASGAVRNLSAIIDAVFEADRDGDDATLDGLVSLLTPADRYEVLAALVDRLGAMVRPVVTMDPGELAEMRARLDNLADLYRTSCGDLARVTAERDAARAEAVEARAFADSLMIELAENMGDD